ncbi:MAG: restriction endonuclease subunit S [Spirochaetaceae bacterium]|nr:restriction endonuclease subunit S [Spirochaetaceae bacterium]
MSQWKKVKIDFKTIKLGDYIEPIKTTVAEKNMKDPVVYGVTNKEGIVQTGKPVSKDISNYIVLEENCFAFNPYRINVGSIGINDNNLTGCVSPAYVVFKTKNGLLPKFLFFYLKSDYGNHLINWYGNRGGVRNALRYSDLCNIDIPDIRNINQELLLKKFSSVSETINQINLELEIQKTYIKQLRQNILQDAIEGKLTVDWRKSHPVIKGNPDYDAKALFEKIQKENGYDISKINKTGYGWCSSILGNFVKLKIGGTPSRNNPEYWKREIPWVSSGEVANCEIFSTKEQISITGSENSAAKILPKGTVLIAMIGQGKTRGQSAILRIEAATNQNVCAVLLPNQLIKSEYMYLYFCSRYEESRKVATGGNQAALSGTKISQFVFSLPPLAEQEEIVARVEKQLQKISELEAQITERETYIKQLMQSILKDAFEER